MLGLKDITYDADTGKFYDPKGRQLGSKHSSGYITLSIDRRNVGAHRVAVALMTGKYPEQDVDHINGDRGDNRWENLREATRSQNLMNRKPNSGRSLPKNVYLHKPSGRFIVKMKISGVTTHFGYHDDLEFATLLAEDVQRKHHKDFSQALSRGT